MYRMKIPNLKSVRLPYQSSDERSLKRDTGTVEQKFVDGWNHPHKPEPTILRIFYVAYSGAEGLGHLAKFSDYWYALYAVQLTDLF